MRNYRWKLWFSRISARTEQIDAKRRERDQNDDDEADESTEKTNTAMKEAFEQLVVVRGFADGFLQLVLSIEDASEEVLKMKARVAAKFEKSQIQKQLELSVNQYLKVFAAREKAVKKN